MNQETVQSISAILDEFAARFGATGAHLWDELVRYQVASAVASPIITLAIIILILAPLPWTIKWAREGGYDNVYEPIVFIQCFMGVVLGVALLMMSHSAIITLIAPEAATLKSLLP